MRIRKDTIEVTEARSGQATVRFFAEDGSYWERNAGGNFRQISETHKDLEDAFNDHLGEKEVEKPKRSFRDKFGLND